jgi:hypothetical protein
MLTAIFDCACASQKDTTSPELTNTAVEDQSTNSLKGPKSFGILIQQLQPNKTRTIGYGRIRHNKFDR